MQVIALELKQSNTENNVLNEDLKDNEWQV
jgi:hypothetical protein